MPGVRDIGRSWSSHPRNVPRRNAAQLAFIERCEAEMSGELARALDIHAERVALVSRVGSDLSALRFENEHPRYTHTGLALRERGGWFVHHLLNTAEGAEGHLYRHSPVDFFRDDPLEYRAALLVPSAALQERIAEVIASHLRTALHSPRYNRVAYPFSTRYQNSNQWVLEVVGAAQSGETTREAVQRYLAAHDLRPSVLRSVGLVRQTLSALCSQNTRFDDQPLGSRLRGRIAFMLESSLRAYLERADAGAASIEIYLLDADICH